MTQVTGRSSPATRVLVVDDNIDAAETLAALLGILEFESRCVHSGRDALAEVESFRPAVVISDLGMPVMDGYEVAREITRRYGAGAPMLVAYSGFGNTVDRQRSIEAGFVHHLTKPVEIGELLTVLSTERTGL